MNSDIDDLAVPSVRPPVPEVPRAEQLAHERQMIFHGHQSGQVPRSAPNPYRQRQDLPGMDSGPVHAAEVCVLDERGGHRRLGRNCPHGLLGADFETVTDVL
jgi:hypothetical protein